MKYIIYKGVRYSKSYYNYLVYKVVREGMSITQVCYLWGVDDVSMVRSWVRDFMKKRGMTRIPKRLKAEAGAPMLNIPVRIENEFRRLEETILYLQLLVEAAFSEVDDVTKKKLLQQLPPKQRKSLKKRGKLST